MIIVNEMNHDTRVIPIAQPGAELTDSAKLPSWLGNSIGYWEDETLVIETRHFREQPALSLATAALQVEERLSRIDANTLRYRFKVTDPNWTESWEGEYPWPATDAKMFEYACHEGNYALGGILRGARLLEQEALGNPISPGGQE